MLVRAAICAVAVAAGAPGVAQTLFNTQGQFLDFPVPRAETPLLTLDQERLFLESRFGQRVNAEIAAASDALAAENRAIEAELTAEERALTEQRETLAPEAFRALADAFDEKVVGFRRAQDAKARALQRRDEAERQAFLRAALPVLGELVAELGASAILDDRAVLFSAESIDVTDRAIARIDAALGSGEALSPPGPVIPSAPAPAPDDATEGDFGVGPLIAPERP